MKLNLRCDDNGNFGFVEKYKPYVYSSGAISIRALVNVGDYISEPYVFRGGEFIPAKQIDAEMGIAKYIKAKKPFYSVLGTGNLVLDMRVAYDLNTKEYIEKNSYFKMYGIVKDSLKFNNGWTAEIRRITTSNDTIDVWLDDLAKKISKFGSDREEFLKSRI